MERLIEHHTKYEEIHGRDETIWMTPSEHVKFHIRLREEGKCEIPVEELTKISMAAYNRTEKARKRVSDRHKQYYLENRDREIIRAREARAEAWEKDPEQRRRKIKEANDKQYQIRGDEIRERKRKHYQENKERIKAQKKEKRLEVKRNDTE